MCVITVCHKCVRLEKGNEELRSRISHVDGVVPEELWSMFPAKGNYLKNILIFTGYETCESILTLSNENELNEVFGFIRETLDLIDESDKKRMLGIFEKLPQKVSLLSGLKPVLGKFIQAVRSFKYPAKTFENVLQPKRRKISSHKSESVVREPDNITINFSVSSDRSETLKGKMLTWLNKKPNCQKYAKQIDFAIVDTFKFTQSNSSFPYSSSSSRETNFIFHYCVCRIEIVMTKKQNGSILLSNAQRHISNNCWLNETKVQGMLTKNKDSSRKGVEYFRLPTRHVER